MRPRNYRVILRRKHSYFQKKELLLTGLVLVSLGLWSPWLTNLDKFWGSTRTLLQLYSCFLDFTLYCNSSFLLIILLVIIIWKKYRWRVVAVGMEGSPSFYGLAYKKIELMPFGFKLRKLTLLLFCLFPVLLEIEIKKFTLHSIEGGRQGRVIIS